MRSVHLSRSTFGWLLIAAGFAVMGAGWAGVQSTPVVAVQLAYLSSGGFVGLGLIVVGVGLLYQDDVSVSRQILEELRDRFDDLEHDVADLQSTVASKAPSPRPRARAS